MAGNSSLAKAKDARQDEFYTQLTDIEKELRHYPIPRRLKPRYPASWPTRT